MNSKKKLLLSAGALAVAIVVWLCVVLFTGHSATDYNTAATNRAQAGGMISKQDILILKSISKNPGGDATAEFYIYRLPDGAKAADFMHLQVSKVDGSSGLVHLGTASCTFIGNDPTAIYNLKAQFQR